MKGHITIYGSGTEEEEEGVWACACVCVCVCMSSGMSRGRGRQRKCVYKCVSSETYPVPPDLVWQLKISVCTKFISLVCIFILL